MNRLTKRDRDGNAYFPECFSGECEGMSGNCLNCQIETQICEKLAEYEDAEEKEYKVQETWEEFKESVSLLTMIIIIFIGIVIITKL